MTVSYFLNIEVTLIRIIEEELEQMTDINADLQSESDSISILNNKCFENNLRHGLVALFAMCNYLECCINGIIRTQYRVQPCLVENKNTSDNYCFWEKPEEEIHKMLEKPMKEKIQQLKKEKKLSRTPAESNRKLWDKVLRTIEFRHELIHYKTNFVQECIIPDPSQWQIKPQLSSLDSTKLKGNAQMDIGSFLTQRELNNAWKEIKELRDIILDASDCRIKQDTVLVEADGREGFGSYVISNSQRLR